MPLKHESEYGEELVAGLRGEIDQQQFDNMLAPFDPMAEEDEAGSQQGFGPAPPEYEHDPDIQLKPEDLLIEDEDMLDTLVEQPGARGVRIPAKPSLAHQREHELTHEPYAD